jgi:bifunctional N-acetylglucosamine-1-phosphate-uridyltransferase/glucosamine-1-phosphate-acetyltransferase GlmU-like protein
MIYFIAAGKGSRMNSSIPKALSEVLGTPNLVRNISLIESINEDYRIVINQSDVDIFKEYISEDKLVAINSGFGSGHAIMNVNFSDSDIIIWGDAVISDIRIVTELIKEKSESPLLIPLKFVSEPYVNFMINHEGKIQEVLFSKYGETSKKGYQDCCIFKVNSDLKEHLKSIHNVLWKGRYIAESNEFEFLYVIHYLANIDEHAEYYVSEYPNAILSYNTKDELNEIQKLINYKY